jgi:hypothetical protein
MSIAVMTERQAAASPRLKARVAGAFYLLTGLTSVVAEFVVNGRLVVSDNAAATAHNILANEPLFGLGFTSALVAIACQLVVMVLLYDLLWPVNRGLAILAATFMLMECAVLTFGSLLQLAPLIILTNGGYLGVFTVAQLQALALLSLTLNAQVFNISLVFFGFWCALIGYLIFRSTFLPRMIGVLMIITGAGYLTLLAPSIANALYPFYLAPAAFGETSLILWLIVFGVNAQRWGEQAAKAKAVFRT